MYSNAISIGKFFLIFFFYIFFFAYTKEFFGMHTYIFLTFNFVQFHIYVWELHIQKIKKLFII